MNEKNKSRLKEVLELLRSQEIETKLIHQRLTKKIEEEKTFAITKFAKETVEILDNFDRFFESVKNQKNSVDPTFLEGVQMIQKSTFKILSNFGI